MITRYALFEGRVRDGRTEAFRAHVLDNILPHWKAFPGATAVRVTFAEFRDDGAPELPMILAISYPDLDTLEAALASDARTRAKAATDRMVAEYFDGRIHHHVTVANDYPL